MKSSSHNIAANTVSLWLVVVGIAVVVIEFYKIAKIDQTTWGWLHDYESRHLTSFLGLLSIAIGIALRVYMSVAVERPLWEVREKAREKARRSPLVVAFGIFLMLAGFGGCLVFFHQAYNLPARDQFYAIDFFKEPRDLALRWLAAGLVGAGIYAYGILFSRSPDVDSDKDSFLDNRPSWMALLTMAAGIVMAVAFYAYGSIEYADYTERYEERRLSAIVLIGLILSFVVFLSGLGMLAKSTYSIPFRGEWNPVDRQLGK